METKQFMNVHLNNLTIDNLFSLTKSTIEYANPASEDLQSALLNLGFSIRFSICTSSHECSGQPISCIAATSPGLKTVFPFALLMPLSDG